MSDLDNIGSSIPQLERGRREVGCPRCMRNGRVVRHALKELDAWAAARKVGGAA